MYPMRKSIGPQPLPSAKLSAGNGYIVIPADTDRETYIQQCYRTGTVMLYTEDQEFVTDVKIDITDIQFIEFPETLEELGSAVAWILTPLHKQPTIIAILAKNDEYINVTEHQFKFRKSKDGSYVEISGRGDKGDLYMTVDSESTEGGNVNLLVKNRNNTGTLNVLVKGKSTFETTDSTTIKVGTSFDLQVANPLEDDDTASVSYIKGQGFDLVDEFGNEVKTSSDGILSKSNKIVQNDGGNQAVLGNELESYEREKLADFDTHIHPTALGPSGPPVVPLSPKFGPRIINWLSKIFSFD